MKTAPRRAIAGWLLFDWAAQPFYTLVLTFLFAPYFANIFIGDAARGQEIWGYIIATAGLIIALLSPVLGAIADASGRRKPWIAAASLALIVGLCGLWLAAPGDTSMLIPVAASVILATAAAEFATVFTNAMMPGLVPADRLGRLSGTGWAVGYAGGLVSLVLTTGFLVADGETGITMLGFEPALPLNTFEYEGDRLIGPFSAAWYVLFVLPLFLFTPDGSAARKTPDLGGAVSRGLRQLRETLLHVRRYENVMRFLVARMFYADGLGAIFAFGGLYAVSLFGWTATELGLFGILLTVTAALGALVGGPLDDRFGAKRIISWGLGVLLLACAGAVSVDKTSILYVVQIPSSAPSGDLFASLGERVYLAFSAGIGLVAGPIQASSRSLLARLAPADMVTEFFGLFAFSGKVTAFAAPLAVGVVTGLTGDQRLGIASIAVFLVIGMVLVLGVKEER